MAGDHWGACAGVAMGTTGWIDGTAVAVSARISSACTPYRLRSKAGDVFFDAHKRDALALQRAHFGDRLFAAPPHHVNAGVTDDARHAEQHRFRLVR